MRNEVVCIGVRWGVGAGGCHAALHHKKALPILGIHSTEATHYRSHLFSIKLISAWDTLKRRDPSISINCGGMKQLLFNFRSKPLQLTLKYSLTILKDVHLFTTILRHVLSNNSSVQVHVVI